MEEMQKEESGALVLEGSVRKRELGCNYCGKREKDEKFMQKATRKNN